MTNAFAIIAHAIQMLLFSPGTTLRVLMPGLAFIMLGALILNIWLPEIGQDMIRNPADIRGIDTTGGLFLMLAALIAGLIGYILIAVLWHRHVLLPEGEKIQPSGSILVGYFWRAVLVGIIQVFALIPVGFAVGIVLFAIGLGEMLLLVELIVQFFAFYIALRVSVILPAAALDERMQVSESWKKTGEVSGTVWGLALLIALVNMGLAIVTGIIAAALPGGAVLVNALVMALTGLIFVSVLTTLYGHLVEGRALG
jgi:hypothetical protein